MLATVATHVFGISLAHALAEDLVFAEGPAAIEAVQDADATADAIVQEEGPALQVLDSAETLAAQAAPEEVVQEPVVIVESDGEEATVSDWTRVTSEMTALEGGAYLVDSDTSIEGDIEVSGDVNLIVGNALRVNGSIHVPADATLRIFLKKGGSKDRSWVYGRGSKPCIVNEGTTEIHGAAVGVGRVSHGVDNFGTLIMYGGEITGCSQDGVHNEKGAKFKLFGGSICDNTGAGFAGEGTIFVGCSPVVENNKLGNVVLNKQNNQTILVEDALRSGAHIGVTTQGKNRFTSGFAKHNTSDDPAKYFFSDTEGTATWDNEGEVVFADFTDSIAYLEAQGKVGHIPADKCQELSSLGTAPKLQNGWYIVSKDTVVDKRIEVEGTAHLILGDGAKLTAKGGIHVCEARSISIYCQEGKTGELSCDRSGTKNEAGIGGNDEECGSCISIYGGKITAKGGEDAAGIGGGCDGDGGYIEIYGGEVEAFGKEYGTGIGGGRDASSGEIMIFGGKVTGHAGCYSGLSGLVTGGGAGIGCGDSGTIGNIQILGGDVTGCGDKYGAGIGGGCENEAGGKITIRNAKVKAEGRFGAGIGGGSFCGHSADEILIVGSDVTATSDCGAGIGSGCAGAWCDAKACKKVNIRTSKVSATSNYGAGIGGGGMKHENDENEQGEAGAGGDVTIDKASEVQARSFYGMNIGGGSYYSWGTRHTAGAGTLTYVD